MIIILDAMGGDNAPDATIKGAVRAINQIEADILLVGNTEVINQKIKESIVAFLLIYEKLQQSKEPIGDISNISVDIEEVNKYLSEL